MFKKFFMMLLISSASIAQLNLRIDTDKESYSYGEKIQIICTVENNSDSTVTFFAYNYHTCQAEFIFNEFRSENWEGCLPAVEEIIFPPFSERIYSWTLDPFVIGLPVKEGEQQLIGYFRSGWNSFNTDHLRDTTIFFAPKFFGGQVILAFDSKKQSEVDSLREILNAEVLEHNESNNLQLTDELWQIIGTQIDSAIAFLRESDVFNYVEYNREIHYDSVYVTSVDEINELRTDYNLYQNYPNPFNPSTTIKLTVGTSPDERVRLEVYNTLGQKIRTLVNEVLHPGTHEVTFDASDLPSGVYFYRLTNGSYSATKKMLLMK